MSKVFCFPPWTLRKTGTHQCATRHVANFLFSLPSSVKLSELKQGNVRNLGRQEYCMLAVKIHHKPKLTIYFTFPSYWSFHLRIHSYYFCLVVLHLLLV